MDIQYISDVHIDVHDTPIVIERQAPFLILAGDVCSPFDERYVPFVADLSGKFDHVILLTGNHCYYALGETRVLKGLKWMRAVDDKVRDVCAALPKKNVHFLQNSTYDIPGTDLTVFGSTLWADVSLEEERDVSMMISDYRCIPGFGVDTGRYLYKLAVKSLGDAMNAKPDKRFVVATHHMPKMSLIDRKYRGSPLNSAFASDVPLADDPRIVAFVYGHTHTPYDDGRFHCNPVGYPGERSRMEQSVFRV